MSAAGRKRPLASLSSTGLQVGFGAEELSFMSTFRKASAVVVGVSLILGLGTVCIGATKAKSKATVRVSSGQLKVPGIMVAGSLVGGSRAFYSPRLPEDSLGGIRLGRPAKEVLVRWGNPTRITVGITESVGPQNAPAQTIPGIPYAPPQTGTFSSAMAAGVNEAARMVGRMNPPMGGGLPGLPGIDAPGMTPPPTADLGGGGGASVLTSEECTWTYDLQNGITLEFILTDGLVTQITVGGQGPWGLSKTRTGLQLGDTYKLVLWVCGYPESQKYAGRFLRLSYVNKSRALYTLLNKKVVGITIAMVPSELQ